MNKQDFLQRLADDKIEYLWVTYHDYNGRACAKTLPKEQVRERRGRWRRIRARQPQFRRRRP